MTPVGAADSLVRSSIGSPARPAVASDPLVRFDSLLARAPGAVDGPALEAAQQLVGSAFVLPLLQQLRTDPLRSELFHGGTGEDLFGQKLDTIIADNIVRRADFPLARAIYDRIIKSGGAASKMNVDG